MASELQAHGFEVAAVVESGEEAIKQTFRLAPELVLMDVQLPGPMDGVAAARHIRVTSGRPVLLIGPQLSPADLQKALECAPYGFVLRPLRLPELWMQVELAIYRHHMDLRQTQLQRENEIAQENLQFLRGLLCMCAGCKRVREKRGEWTKLEEYLVQHANIELTHAFCPECELKYYGTQSQGPVTRRDPPAAAS